MGRLINISDVQFLVKINVLFPFLTWCSLGFFLLRSLHGHILFLNAAIAIGNILLALLIYQRAYMEGRLKIYMDIPVVVILAVGGFSYILSLYVNGFSQGWYFLPMVMSCVGIAWSIVDFGLDTRKARMLFSLVAMYFFVMYVLRGVDPDFIFKGSRNQVSVLFINMAAFVYLVEMRAGLNSKLWPSLVAFAISVMCFGFSGIISAFYFCGCILIYKTVKSKRAVSFIFLSLIITLIFLLNNIDLLNGVVNDFLVSIGASKHQLSRFDFTRLLDTDKRYLIWGDYISTLGIEEVLLGQPLGREYYGVSNLHSSYFLLHSRIGVFSFAVGAMLLYSLAVSYKKDIQIFICASAILLRASADTTSFGTGVFDWVLFGLFFLAYKKSNMKIRFVRVI